ncbi:hypothetical protein ACHAWT_007422 [Skeletonema menzelii]
MNFKIGLLALASIIGTASAIYSAGPCMNDVWQSTGNSGADLSCTATEVSTTVLGIDGPSYCKKGDIIVVNVTTSIYFRASRMDFAIYTLTDNSGASDPIFGSECAIDVLGQDDSEFAPDNIQNSDNDACFDVIARNGWTLEKFKFQDNLHVPCEGEPGTTTQTVHLQNCFSWRTSGQDEVCDASHPAYPGASSKCDCASMDLGIIIYEDAVPSQQPSLSPSISTMPSSVPTLAPSISLNPSSSPSLGPSTSKEPTNKPSSPPSISTQPSVDPTSSPSLSTSPSSNPTTSPSNSQLPTHQPSNSPTVSSFPSSVPSLAPSMSSAPSPEPSLSPSVSAQPTDQPSNSPSVSTEPSSDPTANPSMSSSPSDNPTGAPSISSAPSDRPSGSPSISTQPSSEPSSNPSLSSSPSANPSDSPSISAAPTDQPNGLIDSGEVMLPNIEVSLVDEEGSVVDTTTSASDGSYSFSGVLPDTYSITVVSSTEYVFSPVVNGGNQMRSVESDDNQIIQTGSGQGTSNPITLSGGEERDDMHAGLYKPITIGNKVWNDLNGNGIQEIGEHGIPSVEVALIDGSGVVVGTTETDADGIYRFTGLAPGTYSVEFTLPSGYSFTQSAEVLGDIQLDGLSLDGTDGSFLLADVTSDANVNTGKTGQVDVISGDINLSLDAGIFIPAKIIGFVWHDLNANGIQDEGEEGIEGAVITLFNDASASPGIAVSDSTGKYLFDGLRPGSYYGFFEVPSEEYFMSPTGQGSPDTDSDFDPDSMSNSFVTLLSGDENVSAFDAGLYKLASVGDFVWLDSAADGIQGTDEIGFPFPVTIHLYNANNELQLSTTSNETGSYLFEELMPGYYEIEFVMEEGDILSPPFRGNDGELDSDVNPTTKRAQVTLVSGEDNFSVDAGIIANAPYYPDWTFDIQVCTNDGFDPSWMSTNNEGEQIYLYRNKEECCQNHFWWRMAQCMANEEYKFYRNGEICDSKIKFEDWEMNSPAEWTDTKLFDTLDECCANLFSYDYSGCMGRSPVMFKFDFCFDVGSLLPPIDCQTADIYANVLEDAINLGLGEGSDANITRVGDASLTKVDGSTQCGGSLEGQDFINDLTGTIGEPDLSDLPDSTTVCGVITTESYDCTGDECLSGIYQSIIGSLGVYIDDESLTTNLNSLATTRLPPVQELQVADGITGSLSTYNLLLPTTISSQLGDLKYFKDNDSCGQKTAFASWETKYDTLLDCCSANFNWQLEVCCAEGGGCGSNDPSTTSATTTTTDATATTTATTTENPITSTTSTVPVTTTENPVSSTTSSTVQTTTENPATSTSTTSSTVQTTTENPATSTSTTSSTVQTTTENPTTSTSTTSSTVQTTTENPTTTTTSSTVQTTTVVTTTPPPVLRFFADQSFGAEKLCDVKPLSEFESWEEPYVELKDCCTDKFSWDYANCCAGEGLGGCGDPPPSVKYYPTWQDGKLCQSKTSFEGWEQTYDTLADCCTSTFAYSYDACCQSDGMGGCI